MRLRVRVENLLYKVRDRYASSVYIPEYHDYEGEVYPRPKWVGDDSFCLTTGNKQFPFRTIQKERIICGWLLPDVQGTDEPKQISIMIPTEKSTYIVTSDGLNHSCNCTGYSYRRTCSHVKEIENGLIAA
jgi:hypothetical protein